MFGFLKNKLKEWVSGSSEKLKPEETKEEEIQSDKKEKTSKTLSKKEKKAKKEEIIRQTPKVPKKEDETAIAIETELKEGVPQDIIDEEFEEKTEIEEIVQEAEEEIKETQEIASPREDTSKKTSDSQELKSQKSKISEQLGVSNSILANKIKPQNEIVKVDEEITPKEALKEIEAIKKTEKKSFLSKLFGKKSKQEEIPTEPEKIESESSTPEIPKEKSFFQKVKQSFIYKITEDDFNNLFEDLEMLLLENNVAMEVTDSIKIILSEKLIGKEIKKEDLEREIKKQLKETLEELIIEPDDPLDIIALKEEKPFVILFFGINGTGKTTSIAKLAHLIKSRNLTVALAAADTFRAASIEQISEHAKRLDIPIIKHDYGGDPAAVGFDAVKYAKSHNIEVVLIDTAGRMHTKTNLMSEMEKICRVTKPDLKIFVAESIAGNDATEQAKAFHESITIDGSILSKADIDEKGGTIISISGVTKKPIFYLGVGQNYEDLKLFNKQEFIKSLGLD